MRSAAMTDQLTGPSEFMRLLEIEFDERGPTRVTGSIAADERHHQPWGLVHGGLYTTVVETFATTARSRRSRTTACRRSASRTMTDFLRPHRSGRLDVVATPIHQGRTQQLWQVEIRRPEDRKLVARGQVRLQNVPAGA